MPDEVLFPRRSWEDREAYEATKRKLAGAFRENFKKFEARAGKEILEAVPE